MFYITYLVPALALLACAVLYVLENRAKQKKWIYGAAIFALHVFSIVYFLFAELTMDVLLVFLLASFALAISAKPLK
ncbi:MAG: hypothetical protein FWG34_04190 [Oscillospiraceae bacterium]|nr:hypothetical protein [Oscillospiraceae bacterium]